MIYAALVPCARLGPASELFGYDVQVIDLMRKFNRCDADRVKTVRSE